MTRLEPAEISANHPSEAIVQMAEDTWGFVPNSITVLAHKPAVLRAVNDLVMEIMVKPGEVDEQLKWLVAHVTSRAAGCRYCSTHTAYFGPQRSEIPQEKIEDVWSFETSAHFDESERAALRVARGAGLSPNEVTDDDFADLRRHFSPQQIVEIMSVVSLFGFFNRWNDTFGTDLEDATLGAVPAGM